MADVKICGLRTADDIKAVAKAGARWAGFVFFPKSPRHLSLSEAADLRVAADEIDNPPQIVALTVDADDDELEAIIAAARPDLLQCHGEETPERISAIKTKYG